MKSSSHRRLRVDGSQNQSCVSRIVFRYAGVGLVSLLLLCGDLSGFMAGLDSQASSPEPAIMSLQATDTPTLTEEDVRTVVRDAARAINDTRMVIAVTDRAGRILSVFRKPNAPTSVIAEFGQTADANDLAIALARTGAFFSNDQAPLSSRTVRFISGIHFPPGISFTPNGALYGIENTNRGCDFGGPDEQIFNPGKVFPRAQSLRGVMENLPCNGSDIRGCGRGIATGKANPFDSVPYPQALDPGGVPLFKNGKVVGGIGVVIGSEGQKRAPKDFSNAELAAFTAACPGLGSLLPLPPPGVIFLDGIRLPFVEINGVMLPPVPSNFNCPSATASEFTGAFPQPGEGEWIFGPVAGGVAPDGWLIGPKDSSLSTEPKLTEADVQKIIQQAVDEANITRAAIRLPVGSRTRMVIAVSDIEGNVLGVFRMPDATVFSIDVAVAKARNVTFFSSDRRLPEDLPEVPIGTAVTNRTISFGAQPFFPPGIDGSQPGPFFSEPRFRFLYEFDTNNPCSQGSDRGPAPGRPDNRSGIVFFPGSAPLYKRDASGAMKLVGGLGVSGDGVEQDDVVTDAGMRGYEAPPEIRADQMVIRGVRLPYLKFNRNPER
jgi:uncharacterized protein GlcG (DUF336 family)